DLSAPMLSPSPGALPGPSSTTNGSTAFADQATTNETNNAAAKATGCMMEFLSMKSLTGVDSLFGHGPGAYPREASRATPKAAIRSTSIRCRHATRVESLRHSETAMAGTTARRAHSRLNCFNGSRSGQNRAQTG